MATKQENLDAFIELFTAGEALPLAEDEEKQNKNIWSGSIAEVTEEAYCWYMWDNAGPPKFDRESPGIGYWFIFSDAGASTEPGILFWQKRCRYFARRLDRDDWDLFLEAARITNYFW